MESKDKMKWDIVKWMDNDKSKWQQLYSLFDLNFDCDTRRETNFYNKKNNCKLSRFKYICNIKGKTFELWRIARNIKDY